MKQKYWDLKENKAVYDLETDAGFKELIRPLNRQEYLQLEQNIMRDGCLSPIVVWRGTILDGHNRYEICHRHHIPFLVVKMDFDYREEAIAWICANQLGSHNITEETRKFLIGMQYESEKIAQTKRNAEGVNQYSGKSGFAGVVPESVSGKWTAKRIADENHISWPTVNKYAIYTRTLESIGKKVPEFVPRVLSGRYKVSHNNLVEMSKLSEEQIRKVMSRLELSGGHPYVRYKSTRREIQDNLEDTGIPEGPSVKDMPSFDPDAELTSLSLTVPSWANAIERVRGSTDFSAVSNTAKQKMSEELRKIMICINEMMRSLE